MISNKKVINYKVYNSSRSTILVFDRFSIQDHLKKLEYYCATPIFFLETTLFLAASKNRFLEVDENRALRQIRTNFIPLYSQQHRDQRQQN